MSVRAGKTVPGALSTSDFSSSALSLYGRTEPRTANARFRDVDGHESVAEVYEALDAEAGSSHDVEASDSRPVPMSEQSARERPTRRSAAFQNGRGERGSLDRAPGMDANGSDTPRGESVDGVSEYEQVGRYLLAEEVADHREELVDLLGSIEHSVEHGRPIDHCAIWALADEIEALGELLQVLTLAGTEKARDYYCEEVAES